MSLDSNNLQRVGQNSSTVIFKILSASYYKCFIIVITTEGGPTIIRLRGTLTFLNVLYRFEINLQ